MTSSDIKIKPYDNSSGLNAGYSFYLDGGEIGFFYYFDKQFNKVPFNVRMNITDGKIMLEENKYLGLVKNMMESYPSYVEGGSDIVTGEEQSLKLYRMTDYFISHNVFTSIVYITSNVIPKPFINLVSYIAKVLKIESLDLLNTNFYLHFYSNKDARKLAIMETKIYFWWYLFSKDEKFNDNGFFAFYLWVFRNLETINSPSLLGDINEKIEPFVKYFKVIDETVRLTDLFVMRYGPKYLTEDELRNKPINIYTHFNFDECKNKLRDYISTFGLNKSKN